MQEKFIIAVTEHRVFGYLFLPYVVRKVKNKEYFSVEDRVLSESLKSEYGEVATKLVKIIEEYDDAQIVKLFSKKKLSSSDFYKSVDPEFISGHIIPYIEKRLVKCIDILRDVDIPVYFKDQLQNIYSSDKINVVRKPAETIFNFIKEEEGSKYYLTIQHNEKEINLTDKSGIILCNNPCRLILDNNLFIFEDIDGKKLLPFFTKSYVNIPKTSEKKYFETFVLNSIKKYKVNARGFEIIQREKKPEVWLYLERDLNTNPVLLLKFKYDHHAVFIADKKTAPKVLFSDTNDNYVFKKIDRDYPIEAFYIERLLSLGLKKKEHAYFYLDEDEDDREERLNRIIAWLSRNERHLKDLKIKVEQSFFNVKYSLHEIKLDFKISYQKDWFDLHAIVKIGDFEIPFIRFRQNILKQKRQYELPDGNIVILPLEWFSRYKDLFIVGKTDKESIKLQNHHFSLLEKQIEGPKPKIFEKLRKLSQKDIQLSDDIPANLNAVLRPYQQTGYAWMNQLRSFGLGGCLADDMGLGKTLQTLTLLQNEFNEKRNIDHVKIPVNQGSGQLDLFHDQSAVKEEQIKKPALIVMPASLLHNWYNEIHKFTPSIKTMLYTGTNRTRDVREFQKWDVVLTTYGVVRIDSSFLKSIHFYFIILDESQMVKNPASKTYEAVHSLKADHRIVLTGTPIENSLSDLWAQLNFLNKGMLGSFGYFKEEFIVPIEKNDDETKQKKLQDIIQPFILRRTKREVAKELPELSEQTIYCDLTEEQQYLYEEEKSKIRNNILQSLDRNGVEKSTMLILKALTKLRQLANHPVMVNPRYKHESGKFNEVTRSLENLRNEKNKAIIFSSFVKHLNIFSDYFDERGINYVTLTGQTREREKVVSAFQNDPDINFFLISLKAGGVGLNLTAAEYVFMLDPWWNPAAESQAINRAHRIGQENKVFVYRYISNNTVEEKITRLQEKKSRLADIFVNTNNPFKYMSYENVTALFE